MKELSQNDRQCKHVLLSRALRDFKLVSINLTSKTQSLLVHVHYSMTAYDALCWSASQSFKASCCVAARLKHM